MKAEWVNGLLIITLTKCALVLTREEVMRALKRGKTIKRAEKEVRRGTSEVSGMREPTD